MNYHDSVAPYASPDPNGLFAGPYPVVDRKVLMAGAVDLPAGAVLGQVTASGDYCLSVADATNGSEKPVAVLAHDVAADESEAMVYLTGWYRGDRLTFGAGHTVASAAAGLRGLGIHIS